MPAWWVVARFELLQWWRTKIVWMATLGVLAAGSIAILQGASRVERERVVLRALEPELAEQVRYLTKITTADDDLGLLLYYLAMPVSHEPGAWAPVATGLRAIHAESRHLRFTGLVPQLYQSEVENPIAALAGHFDLAFVLVFLIPLFIIALSYDVRSRDEDLGTDGLIRSQPMLPSRLIVLRLGLRAGLVCLVSLALLALATLKFGIVLNLQALIATGAALAYIGVWFLAVFFVVSWGRSSTFTAMLLTGGWISACVLLPALLHVALLVGWPVRGGLELTLDQRLDMNARWDRPKQDTLRPFFQRRPEWSATEVPEDRFSSPWYYAMHEMGDAQVAERMANYQTALERRARWTARAALALPPLALELLFERLAGTDLTTALARRQSIANYHEQLKGTVYPWIFRYQGLAAFDLERLPRYHFSSDTPLASLPGVRGLLSTLLLLSLLTPLGMRRLDRVP